MKADDQMSYGRYDFFRISKTRLIVNELQFQGNIQPLYFPGIISKNELGKNIFRCWTGWLCKKALETLGLNAKGHVRYGVNAIHFVEINDLYKYIEIKTSEDFTSEFRKMSATVWKLLNENACWTNFRTEEDRKMALEQYEDFFSKGSTYKTDLIETVFVGKRKKKLTCQ